MKFLHTTFKVLIIIASILAFLLFVFFAPSVFAQDQPFVPLVGIPGLEGINSDESSIPRYINGLYLLIIVVGALIGVLKLAFAGVKYSMSDIVTSKESAKEDIKGVLLGLAILLIPFIVLNTINPSLTSLDILRNAPEINLNKTRERSTATPLEALNDRVGDTCSGRPINPACPTNVTPTERQIADTCNGFYDYKVSTCFSRDSSFTYNTTAGGNFTSLADSGWILLCGGLDKVNQQVSGNQVTYSCNQ